MYTVLIKTALLVKIQQMSHFIKKVQVVDRAVSEDFTHSHYWYLASSIAELGIKCAIKPFCFLFIVTYIQYVYVTMIYATIHDYDLFSEF